MKYLRKCGRQENLMTLCLLCNTVYKQNTVETRTKGCIFSFSKKGDLEITKNYKSIALIAIDAKVYNVMLFSHIQSEIEKIHRKIKRVFGEFNPHQKF